MEYEFVLIVEHVVHVTNKMNCVRCDFEIDITKYGMHRCSNCGGLYVVTERGNFFMMGSIAS